MIPTDLSINWTLLARL